MLFSIISLQHSDFGKNRFEGFARYTDYTFEGSDSDSGINYAVNYEHIFGASRNLGLQAQD